MIVFLTGLKNYGEFCELRMTTSQPSSRDDTHTRRLHANLLWVCTQSSVFLSELPLTASHTLVCSASFQKSFLDILVCEFSAAGALRVKAKHTFESVPFIFVLGTQCHGWLQKSTLASIWLCASWIVASLAKLAIFRCALGKETSRTHTTPLSVVMPVFVLTC